MEPLAADDPRQVGVYRLRFRLGAGGMGRVYLGFSPAGRAVAVKVVHAEFARNPEFVRRFGREVRAAEAVSGAYTAPVVAAGPDDDPPWLATVFVPGPSLSDVVEEAGPLPEAALWRLTGGLAEALQAVHARGLVHRDLKPGECAAGRGRSPGDRLRHLPGPGRHRPHREEHDRGHPGVHVARAGARAAGRAAQRCVLPRQRDRLRGDRGLPVRWRRAAHHGLPDRARRTGSQRRSGSVPGPGGPLPGQDPGELAHAGGAAGRRHWRRRTLFPAPR